MGSIAKRLGILGPAVLLPVRVAIEEDALRLARVRRSLLTTCAVATAGLVLLALTLAPVSAHADLSFGSFGSGAGQTERPAGIAVDAATGHLYVADRGNNRIDVFDSAGNFLMAFGWGVANGAEELQNCVVDCRQGLAGVGAGQLSSPEGIAVDNDPTSPSFHDIYVAESSNGRVQEFGPSGNFILMFGGEVDKTTHASLCTVASGHVCGAGVPGGAAGQFGRFTLLPIAVGPDGTVYVGDSQEDLQAKEDEYANRVEQFDASGAFVGQVQLSDGFRVRDIAVDSTGAFYTDSGGEISKYGPSGNLLNVIGADSNFFSALALDSSDDLFAFHVEANYNLVTEYDSGGVILRSFGYGQFGLGGIEADLTGIAVYHTATGDVFGTEAFVGAPSPGNRVVQISFPPPGPIVLPRGASAVGNAKATLNAEVNPEGEATTFHFQYITKAQFQADGESFGAGTVTTPESASIGSDFTLHSVSFTASVVPETIYHFRVVATSAGGSTTGSEAIFETLPPLQIDGAWSTEVGTDTAQLHAEVDPLGIPTTGYFQYVDDASYKISGFTEAIEAPNVGGGAGPIDFGSAEAGKIGGAQLSGLAPDTVYHYRIVAVDPFVTVFGAEHTLTTFPPPSPPDEACENQIFRTGASALLPDCRAYEMVSPVDKEGGDASQLGAEARENELNESSTDGQRFTYSSYRPFADPKSAPNTSQFLATRDPQGGWSSEAISAPRGIRVLPVLASIESEFRAFSPDLCSGWLRGDTDLSLAEGAIEGFSNLYKRQNCAGGGYEALTTLEPAIVEPNTSSANFKPELQGLSVDGGCAVFRANARLTEDASSVTEGAAGGRYQLYASCGGVPRLVSVLPDGSASDLFASAGTGGDVASQPEEGHSATVWRAVSTDGSRVYWTASSATNKPGTIYVREHAERPQSAVEGGECTEPEEACTYPVSGTAPVSGDAQFWVATPDGSTALFTIGGELYEFDFAGKHATLIAKKMVGLLGASEDLSRLYVVSEEALDGEAKAGEPNLYLAEGGAFTFVATLSAADAKVGRFPPSPLSPYPIQHSARVSPDGSRVAFTSTESLTGYDNTDANSGQADTEVYLFDADAESGKGRLSCISCNPTGERPSGVQETGFNNERFWEAAQIPTWETELYPERALSDDGQHLFFESMDALVPRDTNGKQDVYEWDAGDREACKAMGAELFVESSGGCLSLISSGESPEDSKFLDATPDGSDVFIATASSLLPQDTGLLDVYDAREDGGFPLPSSPAACEGEACQSPPSPPNDSTPASASFSGPSGLVSALTTTVAPKKTSVAPHGKTASQMRARRLARALKECRAKARSKRKSCEVAARKRYGAKSNDKARGSNRRVGGHEF